MVSRWGSLFDRTHSVLISIPSLSWPARRGGVNRHGPTPGLRARQPEHCEIRPRRLMRSRRKRASPPGTNDLPGRRAKHVSQRRVSQHDHLRDPQTLGDRSSPVLSRLRLNHADDGRELGIPTVVNVRSWKHATSKTLLAARLIRCPSVRLPGMGGPPQRRGERAAREALPLISMIWQMGDISRSSTTCPILEPPQLSAAPGAACGP